MSDQKDLNRISDGISKLCFAKQANYQESSRFSNLGSVSSKTNVNTNYRVCEGKSKVTVTNTLGKAFKGEAEREEEGRLFFKLKMKKGDHFEKCKS
jgi:Flp pilus assembly secretin CpaC